MWQSFDFLLVTWKVKKIWSSARVGDFKRSTFPDYQLLRSHSSPRINFCPGVTYDGCLRLQENTLQCGIPWGENKIQYNLLFTWKRMVRVETILLQSMRAFVLSTPSRQNRGGGKWVKNVYFCRHEFSGKTMWNHSRSKLGLETRQTSKRL